MRYRCSPLQKLTLSYCNIGAPGAALLADAITPTATSPSKPAMQPKLTFLDLQVPEDIAHSRPFGAVLTNTQLNMQDGSVLKLYLIISGPPLVMCMSFLASYHQVVAVAW